MCPASSVHRALPGDQYSPKSFHPACVQEANTALSCLPGSDGRAALAQPAGTFSSAAAAAQAGKRFPKAPATPGNHCSKCVWLPHRNLYSRALCGVALSTQASWSLYSLLTQGQWPLSSPVSGCNPGWKESVISVWAFGSPRVN